MPTPKLLDQVRTVARVKHFSLGTERAYVGWIRRFILFHHKRHPREMAETESVSSFLILPLMQKSRHLRRPLRSVLCYFYIVRC